LGQTHYPVLGTNAHGEPRFHHVARPDLACARSPEDTAPLDLPDRPFGFGAVEIPEQGALL
jgi:hypothetical protein